MYISTHSVSFTLIRNETTLNSVTANVGAPVVGSFVVGLRVGSFVVYVELIERAEEVAVSILQLVTYKKT